MTARPFASSPRWRRCRIRAFRGSLRRSSRISALAFTCRIATPRPARFRPRRRPGRGSDPAQPLLDFYAGCRSAAAPTSRASRCALNDNIDYEGGVVTWIDNLAGERPYGNDLDPTLNLDILEVSFRNLARWKIIETPPRLETVHRIIGFQKRLVKSGAFTDPRSHIYYLPELYSAYFGRCYAAFTALPAAAQQTIDPDGTFAFVRTRVLAYVQDEMIAHEMNAFDAALALMALAHLGAAPAALYAGAALHRHQSRRRRTAWAVQGL